MKNLKELEALFASIKNPYWKHENPQLNEDEHIMSIQKDPEVDNQTIFIIANRYTFGIDSSVIILGDRLTGEIGDRIPVQEFLGRRCDTNEFADWWYKMIEDYAVCFMYTQKIRPYKQN